MNLVLFAVVSTALLGFLGYGLVKLLLPREWREAEGYLAPLLGYVLLLLVGYHAVRTVFNLVGALFLCLGIALVLNVVALWRRRGESLAIRIREHGPAWLLALCAFLVAVLPLLHYGYSTPIGENWDPENYLAVAEYLSRTPVSGIEEMPPNPLRDLNAHPPRIGLTLGFSVLQGTLGQVRGWDARRTFAPTVALLYALTVLALYGLFRRGFRMERRPGLLATLVGGLYALALWIALFNFGMQMAALPLVPLALTLWLAALRRPSWRTVLLAALAVAALPVAYYPALTVFVPVALGLGLCEVLRANNRRSVLLAGFGTALLSPALAWGTLLDYGAGFSVRYSQQMTTLGVFRFISWGEILGLMPFSRTPPSVPALWNGASMAAIVLLGAFAVAGILRNGERWLWIAALLPAALYLGLLRGWFWHAGRFFQEQGLFSLGEDTLERFKPYPYAYMKGAVFVAPLLLGLAMTGWGELWRLTHKSSPRLWRVLLVCLFLLPAALVVASCGQLVARYWPGPSHFDRTVLEVEQGIEQLPEGAAVYLTGRPEISRPVQGFLAYLLREHTVYGRLSTAYGEIDNRVPGDAPPFALLDSEDDPHPLGWSPSQRLWEGGGMVLYERDPAVRSFLDLREDAYGRRPAGSIHVDQPLAERLLLSYGPYRSLSEAPLALYADGDRLSLEDDLEGSTGTGSLLLAFAAYEPATVTLQWDDGGEERFSLPAGLSLHRSQPHALPGNAAVLPAGGADVWVCWAALVDAAETAEVQLLPEALLLPEVTAEDGVLDLDLHVHNDSARPLRLAVEIWQDTFQSAGHYAWWELLPLPDRGTVEVRVDVAAREVIATIAEEGLPLTAHPGAEAWPEVPDGAYFAALWVYYGHHVVEVLPIGRFNLQNGAVEDLRAIDLSLRPLWPHSPGTTSGARFGPAIELAAFERPAGPFSPGDDIPLALEWHALDAIGAGYSVTAQIVGTGRLWGQWDGPLGQWYPAPVWRTGQYVRDDVPLQVAPDTPRGHYRLIVAVYDPVTMQRLPVRSVDGQELGDALDLGEIVVR